MVWDKHLQWDIIPGMIFNVKAYLQEIFPKWRTRWWRWDYQNWATNIWLSMIAGQLVAPLLGSWFQIPKHFLMAWKVWRIMYMPRPGRILEESLNWRISFWFFGVFHLWCFCCIYFGWQRDGKEKMEIKAQGEFFSLRRNSYGHWTFEFFAKHCKVTTDNQIMNVWDGCYYFIMCWPFFRRSVFVFSPLGLLVVVFSSDQRFASRK